MESFVINAVAPTRICDVGGWTDTHFARHGAVFNIAIYPYVEVQIHALLHGEPSGKVKHPSENNRTSLRNPATCPQKLAERRRKPATPCSHVATSFVQGATNVKSRRSSWRRRVTIAVENYGTSYTLDPENIVFDKHPLIEAAVKRMPIPKGAALRINIYSSAPPGASMGTSAAVSVALIGALNALAGDRLSPHEAAALAHAIETEDLQLECGVQDQIASAYGGISLIEITGFPRARRTAVEIPDATWWELENRLVLTYIGKPHNSSETHKMVIAGMGKSAARDKRLEKLRQLAYRARDALVKGDFAGLGEVFNRNTATQRALHKNLVCGKFEEIISIAGDFNALGCKVNGAGGDGGSIAILTDGDMSKKRKLEARLAAAGFKTIPIYLSRRGLRVWKSRSGN